MNGSARWRLAALLFVAGAVNYLDRVAISIASPAIQADLHLDAAQMGFVFSSFFVGYALFNVVGGWAADRYRPKLVLAAAIVVWSSLCAGTALAQGFISLLVLRALFGAAEGPFGATSAKIVSRSFHKAAISRALAAIGSGTPVGALLAGPLVGLLFVDLGWRGTLGAVGCIGLAFAAAWLRFSPRDPDPPPVEIGACESRVEPLPKSSLTRLAPRQLWNPVIVANALAYFSYTWLLAIYLSWLPSYLTSTYHLDVGRAAIGSAAPWVMGFVGIWIGGLSSDALCRWTGRPLASRVAVQVVGLAIAGSGTVAMGHVTSAESGVAVVAMSLMGLYIAGTSFWAVVQDVVPSVAVGRVSGWTHMVANVGGIVGPAATGLLVKRTGSFDDAWVLSGTIAIVVAIGAASVVFAAPRQVI
jgi:ACS family hexuronate transporter-like MFS transporter